MADLNELAKVYGSSYASPHHIVFTVDGLRNLIEASQAVGAAAVPATPDDTKVTCPECCHQFRAIPVQVQSLLLSAGFEPPFSASSSPASTSAPDAPPECESEAEKRAFAFGWWKAHESIRAASAPDAAPVGEPPKFDLQAIADAPTRHPCFFCEGRGFYGIPGQRCRFCDGEGTVPAVSGGLE